MTGKRILLIIGGGIAAYKCLDLIRRLKERGIGVRTVMTRAAGEFITPLSVGALTNERVFTHLFDLNAEQEIGHIRLSREADLLVVAPATADLLAKMANGIADDLATTTLLATDKPVLVAPAMNPHMWRHPATQRNVAWLDANDINFSGPDYGEMAESGEAGLGRMSEVADLVVEIENMLAGRRNADDGPLDAKHVLITAGPTHEPIDPVRYIANRSSGRQGYALARAAANAGARVTMISGPTDLPDPAGVTIIRVNTADEMLRAVQAALPADIGIFAAAVADWKVAKQSNEKIKKAKGAKGAKVAKAGPPSLELVENPDILKTIATDAKQRPPLVIGFAAETEKVIEHARAKLKSKGCDWIVANDVSPESGVMGGTLNAVHIVSEKGVDSWSDMPKQAVADRLIERAAATLGGGSGRKVAAE